MRPQRYKKKRRNKKNRDQRESRLMYEPLVGPKSIRLLHIEPASQHDAPLLATLIHTSLASKEYEALSYAWGDPVFSRSIDVSGHPLNITQNLDVALRAFRLDNDVRAIWVDAICINQQDENEKGKQVAIMGDIYQAANRVLVWLGPGTAKTSEAMQFLSELSSQSARFGISEEVGRGRIYCEIPRATISGQEADKVIAKAYSTGTDLLLSVPWFSRLWIVQELCLAQEVIVHYGDKRLYWVDLARGVETLTASINRAAYCQTGSPYDGILPKTARVWDLVNSRDILVMMRNPVLRYNIHIPKMVASGQMSTRQCKDDRDRVYGMLALVNPDPPILPDYSKTIEQVYTEFAARTSPESSLFTAGLSYRGASSLPPLISSPNYLPSWVPDLRPSRSKWRPIFDTGFATSKPFWKRHSVDPRYPTMLALTGTHFDNISKQYGTKTAPEKDCRIDYMAVITVMRTLLAEYRPREGANDGFPKEVFLTLAVEHEDHKKTRLFSSVSQFLDDRELHDKSWILRVWRVYSRVCLEFDGEVFQNVLTGGSVKTLSQEGKLGLRIHSYLCDLFSKHNFFTTARGYLGLSPRGAKISDVIAVFNGCSTPFVIRDAGKVLYEKVVFNNPFYVVGPCYVHGIMDLEIYKRQDDGEFNHLRWMPHPSLPPGDILADVICLV